MMTKEGFALITVATSLLQISGVVAAQFLNDRSVGSDGINQGGTQAAADWVRTNNPWISVLVIALLGWV